MGTTADKLNYLLGTKTAIKEAIVAKGVSVADSDTFRSYAKKINSIKSSAPMKDVNLFDYDGTILYSYTKDEFLALTALPTPPTIEGLQSSWCNTLTEAQEYVNQYGIWDIGVAYHTNDKYTSELHYTIGERKTIMLYASMQSTTIYWGDGSSEYVDTFDDSSNTFQKRHISHTYEKEGNYVVRFLARYANELIFEKNNPSNDMLIRAIIYDTGNILQFYNCPSLELLCIYEDGYTNIKINNCHNLKTLLVPKLPQGYSSSISECSSLELISGLWESRFFGSMPSLRRCVAKSVYSFRGCSRLQQIVLPQGITQIPIFADCTLLPRLTYPETCTSIAEEGFSGCKCLREFTLPNNIANIAEGTFSDCISLRHLVFPASVVSISANAFRGCVGLVYLDFSNHTQVPTISSYSFYEMSTDCKIIVPDALYDSWIAASNWSTYASQIVKASEYNG